MLLSHIAVLSKCKQAMMASKGRRLSEDDMKVTVNVECSPQEARAFFGLPDVTPVNERVVAEVVKRLEANMELADPTELIKNWTSYSGLWADSFLQMLSAATGQGGEKK